MKKIIGIMLALALCVGTTACGGHGRGSIANDELTLEIYVADYGYGTKWVQPIVDMFVEEDWVKEKYPGLKVPPLLINSESGFGLGRARAGETNTIDLIIDISTPNYYIEEEYKDGVGYFEDLSELYATTVPGENITFEQKMQPNFLEMSMFTSKTGERQKYCVPWVTGFQGFLYNKSKFDKLNIEVPLTSDQLRDETCKQILDNNLLPFVFATNTSYWAATVFRAWWAQYEGVEAYNNFYNGLVKEDEDTYVRSVDVIKQQGRYEALKAIEELIGTNGTVRNPNVHENCNTYDFGQAQAQFLLGNGLMMPNGDWFETEMRETAEEGIEDVFTVMHTPVISAIIDRTPSIANDEQLRLVIKAIDAGTGYTGAKASVAALTEADYKIVEEARKIIIPIGHHTAYVPSYATAKEAAKDFLLYLSTDKAINSFMKRTYGAGSPFTYDVKAKDPALYNSFSQLHRDRIDLSLDCLYTMDASSFKLSYFGGLGQLNSIGGSLDGYFTSFNTSERKTAEDIYKSEIDYWTPERWHNALVLSGYTN